MKYNRFQLLSIQTLIIIQIFLQLGSFFEFTRLKNNTHNILFQLIQYSNIHSIA